MFLYFFTEPEVPFCETSSSCTYSFKIKRDNYTPHQRTVLFGPPPQTSQQNRHLDFKGHRVGLFMSEQFPHGHSSSLMLFIRFFNKTFNWQSLWCLWKPLPQVEDMEKKLDFLVDMHIQHTEHLQVDSAGTARMTLEACDSTVNGEIRRVFLNYSEVFPHMSYQVPVGKESLSCRGRRGVGDRVVAAAGSCPPAAVARYTERPTVLPISSLQDLSVGPGRTTGGRGGDSPLSMLSVNHEELERSLSGFSISGEREGADLSIGTGMATGEASWTRPRPSYLAEGETDTDTDPFTPSGGAMPLSSTGEGFGDSEWNTPPWEESEIHVCKTSIQPKPLNPNHWVQAAPLVRTFGPNLWGEGGFYLPPCCTVQWRPL